VEAAVRGRIVVTGVMPVSPLDDLRVAEWDEMIDVNIKGMLYGLAAVLPVFRRQGFGQG
jgi:NADP-dependent 3-hydroxy acid dehydrogenase YdfG